MIFLEPSFTECAVPGAAFKRSAFAQGTANIICEGRLLENQGGTIGAVRLWHTRSRKLCFFERTGEGRERRL